MQHYLKKSLKKANDFLREAEGSSPGESVRNGCA